MSDLIWNVSDEKELEDSLLKAYDVTVINKDFEPAIFNDYNINYCFNEIPEDRNYKFHSLKHVSHPYKSISVIQEPGIYNELLKRVLRGNHSVAFVLSTTNHKLLRLCQCFIGAVSNSLHTEVCPDGDFEIDQTMYDFLHDVEKWSPIPYLIGKFEDTQKMSLPIWSSFWDVNIQTLDALFINVFRREFGEGFTYSKEGLVRLQKLIEDSTPNIIGDKKLRLYPFDFYTQPYHCRQSIEGPREMLDPSLVEKIKSLAVEASKVLREYEIKDQKDICQTAALPNNVLLGKCIPPRVPVGRVQPQSLTLNDPYGLFRNTAGCEESGLYNVDSGVRLLIESVFDYSRVEDPQKELKTFYADAAGELATPTASAIDERIVEPGDDNCCALLGNRHSFSYRISNKNWVAVWPHGEKELMTKLCGAEEAENYYKNQASKTAVQSSPSGDAEEKDVEKTQPNPTKNPEIPPKETADIPRVADQDQALLDTNTSVNADAENIKEVAKSSAAVTIDILGVTNNQVNLTTKMAGKDSSSSIGGNKILMFLIIYYYSVTGKGIGYLSKRGRSNTQAPELVGYDKDNNAMPISPKIYPIKESTEYSQHFRRLVNEILTGRMEINGGDALLKSIWHPTADRKKEYNTGCLSSIKINITAGFFYQLKENLPKELLDGEKKQLDSLFSEMAKTFLMDDDDRSHSEETEKPTE